MIQERAMLAAVHISIWTAVKHDRGVSRDVAERNGAPMSAGRYNKQLLRGADKLDELRTLAGQVRQYFYKITLPWTDEGYRLLPANLYFDLTARMREFEASFEQGVEAFLTVYPQYIEQVRPELNGLFREEDYPKAEKLRRKFGVKLEVLPIPTGNDFRVQMSAEEQARVAREIDSNVRQSLVRGTEDLWSRLRDVVSHMVDRLNEPESRFHATLVTNIFDLVELLPRLNVTGDPELNRFAEEARQKLCTYTAHDLKKHELLRVGGGFLERFQGRVRQAHPQLVDTLKRLVKLLQRHESVDSEAGAGDSRYRGHFKFSGDAGVRDGEQPASWSFGASEPDVAASGGGTVAEPAIMDAERNAEAILVGGLVGFFAHDEAGRILDFDHLTSQPLRVFLQPVHPSLPVAATAYVGNGLEEQSLW